MGRVLGSGFKDKALKLRPTLSCERMPDRGGAFGIFDGEKLLSESVDAGRAWERAHEKLKKRRRRCRKK